MEGIKTLAEIFPHKEPIYYRGCENVRIITHGEWGDPDLISEIDGTEYCFNYWDIENALWSNFCEDTKTQDDMENKEEEFSKYVKENCIDYLQEVIAGGYFEDGITNWHDMMKGA